jgi:hypothetical protein
MTQATTCRGCDAAIPTHNGPGRQREWCSEACRVRAHRASTRTARQPSPSRVPRQRPIQRIQTCPICARLYWTIRTPQRTCSAACSKVYKNNQGRRDKFPGTCVICGEGFRASKPSRYCSPTCVGTANWYRITGGEKPKGKPPARWREAQRRVAKAAQGKRGRRCWVAGQCADCGENYVDPRRTGGKAPLYCSPRCARRVAERTRRAVKAAAFVAPVWRKRIFERDGWVCQLCGKPTQPDKQKTVGTKHPHPLAPVLDHIIPLSRRGGGGTHEPGNVQCAHFQCNSLKSDGVFGNGEQMRLAC